MSQGHRSHHPGVHLPDLGYLMWKPLATWSEMKNSIPQSHWSPFKGSTAACGKCYCPGQYAYRQTTYHYHRTLFLLLIFFGVQLIYTIILVSAIQHSASVIHRHTGCVVCCVKSLQSCPTLCDPMDHSPPGSSIHGILQARIPEWVAMLSSRGSSQPKDQTCISYTSCIGRWVLYH